MSDLIRLEDVLAIIDKRTVNGKLQVAREVLKLPTIEPERKKGEWIDKGDPLTLRCSKCGYRVARYNNTNFCPNCGNDKR